MMPLVVLFGAGLAMLPVGSANAVEIPEPITVAPGSQTIEYGEYWSFGALTAAGASFDPTAVLSVTGGPEGYTAAASMYPSGAYDTGIYFGPMDGAPALVPGTYSFTVRVEWTPYLEENRHVAITDPAPVLTIVPAALDSTLTMLEDPADPSNAIISMRLAGLLVEQAYPGAATASIATTPAGTWNLRVTDEAGDTALEKSIDQPAGQFFASYYWTGIDPQATFTAHAEFVPAAASAANFDVEPATSVSYTSPALQRPQPTASAPAAAPPDRPEPVGYVLPVWLVTAIGVLSVGLAAWLVTLLVRRRIIPTTVGVGP